jgi:hypothetical protein
MLVPATSGNTFFPVPECIASVVLVPARDFALPKLIVGGKLMMCTRL